MDDLQAPPSYASLNITYSGQNGDLADPVLFDLADDQVRAIATEAVRAGGVRGVDAHPTADFSDFVVDRVAAHDGLPHRLLLRPKTPFGGCDSGHHDRDPLEKPGNATRSAAICRTSVGCSTRTT